VPDVVLDHGGIVAIAAGPDDFAVACERAESHPGAEKGVAVSRLLRRRHWDAIAGRMEELIDAATVSPLNRMDRP
jgi:hypothetical protein